MAKYGAQVGEVEEVELAVVAVLEDEREHARLGSGQTEPLGKQQGTERRDRRPELRAACAREAEELDRTGVGFPRPARLLRPLLHAIVRLARRADPRHIALQVGQ